MPMPGASNSRQIPDIPLEDRDIPGEYYKLISCAPCRMYKNPAAGIKELEDASRAGVPDKYIKCIMRNNMPEAARYYTSKYGSPDNLPTTGAEGKVCKIICSYAEEHVNYAISDAAQGIAAGRASWLALNILGSSIPAKLAKVAFSTAVGLAVGKAAENYELDFKCEQFCQPGNHFYDQAMKNLHEQFDCKNISGEYKNTFEIGHFKR